MLSSLPWSHVIIAYLMPVWVCSTTVDINDMHGSSTGERSAGCFDPGEIKFGWRDRPYLRAPQRWKLKSTIKYTCEPGYVPVGRSTLTCAENGMWFPATTPKCVNEIDYPPDANPGNDIVLTLPVNYAVLNGSGSTDDRAIVDYHWTLETTNGLSADMTGTRTAVLHLENLEVGHYVFKLTVTDISGQSSSRSLNVVVQSGYDCGQPPDIPNAVWQASLPRGRAKEGTLAYYSCEGGYQVHRPETYRLQCTNGHWEGLQPKCVQPGESTTLSQSTCPKPVKINNGYYTFLRNMGMGKSSERVAEGVQVYYACEEGYQLVGKPLRVCVSGRWTNELPTCISPTKPVCGMPPQLAYGDYNFLGQSGGDLANLKMAEGSQAFYFCHDGFQFSDGSKSGLVKLVCEKEHWVGNVPKCEKRTRCDPPQEIPHGTWVFDGINVRADKYAISTRILYECDVGYQSFGAVLIECESTGYWSNFPPKCLMKGMYCEDPGEILNGYFVCMPNHCGMYKVGVKVHFVCKAGYEPQGEVLIDCLDGGVWAAPNPTCLPVSTTPLMASLMDINSNTMTVVIATSCSVLGLLLVVMVVVALQRRKSGNRLCHPVPPPPPPYSCPRAESVDEHDRVALIAFADGVQVVLPSYEEAVRGNRRPSSRSSSESGSTRRGPPGEYRPLPSIPHSLRGPRDSVRSGSSHHSQDHHRNSIITTASTATRDNLSLAFGSMDTMNVSDGTSTTVTIETYDSAASNPSISTSQRATAGSLGSSNGSLANEDAPLLTENHTEARTLGSRSQSEQSPIEEEKVTE